MSKWKFTNEILTTEDYESMFDTYDIMGLQTIPRKFLANALKAAGKPDPEKIVQEKIGDDDFVNKVSFLYIMSLT